MKNKVAIIGYGYVGKAMHKIFPDAYLYDVNFKDMIALDAAEPIAQHYKHDFVNGTIANKAAINQDCGLAIICVPTPMQDKPENEFQAVDLIIIEDVAAWLDTPLILIKSTVPPGTTAGLNAKYPKKNFCFSPEYVGEGKYQITPWKYMDATDPRTHEFQIIGGAHGIRDQVANYFIKRLGPEKTYYLIDAVEAEIIKYMENSWGAMKVIFANEFYQLCNKLGASYIRVREGWALDNRVERMHTAVFVDAEGFAGKCYPKDLNGIVRVGDEVGADMSLIKAVLRKNKDIQTNEKV